MRTASSVDWIDDATGFASLQPEWDALLADSGSNAFFLTWEWLHTWWKHLSGTRAPCLATVRDAGRLVAIAPLIRRTRRAPRLIGASCLEFLGTGSAGSDHLDLIVRRGAETTAVASLAEALDRKGVALDMSHVRLSGSHAASLVSTLTGGGWRTSLSTVNTAPFIPLSGLTWRSYLAGLSRAHRYTFERKLRRLEREFDVRFDLAVDEPQVRDGLRVLIGLHLDRWRSHGGSDAFHTGRLVAFHEELTRVALQRGWLRLFVMRLDGVPAAALYGFAYDRTFSFYQSGFDPAFAGYGVGVVVMGLAIRAALEEGSREFDMLHGAERYKYHWASHSRDLARMTASPPSLRGLLHHGWVGTRMRAGRFARRIRSASPLPPAAPARPDPVSEDPHAA